MGAAGKMPAARWARDRRDAGPTTFNPFPLFAPFAAFARLFAVLKKDEKSAWQKGRMGVVLSRSLQSMD